MVSEIDNSLLARNDPATLAIDALNEARLPTAKAMYVMIVHADEDGIERVYEDRCGVDPLYLVYGMHCTLHKLTNALVEEE